MPKTKGMAIGALSIMKLPGGKGQAKKRLQCRTVIHIDVGVP